jgi:hypothetical protein
MTLAVGNKIVSQLEILQLILCIGFHLLGLLHKISTSSSVLVSGLCMLYQYFYGTFSCYLPLTKPSIKYLYSCSYTDIDCICCTEPGLTEALYVLYIHYLISFTCIYHVSCIY